MRWLDREGAYGGKVAHIWSGGRKTSGREASEESDEDFSSCAGARHCRAGSRRDDRACSGGLRASDGRGAVARRRPIRHRRVRSRRPARVARPALCRRAWWRRRQYRSACVAEGGQRLPDLVTSSAPIVINPRLHADAVQTGDRVEAGDEPAMRAAGASRAPVGSCKEPKAYVASASTSFRYRPKAVCTARSSSSSEKGLYSKATAPKLSACDRSLP